jgi:hypothetical protein
MALPTAIPATIASVSALNCSFWLHGSRAAPHASKEADRHSAVPAANPLDIFGIGIGKDGFRLTGKRK